MSVHPSVVCGVDGGGTSTRVLVATFDGEVLGEGGTDAGAGTGHESGSSFLVHVAIVPRRACSCTAQSTNRPKSSSARIG